MSLRESDNMAPELFQSWNIITSQDFEVLHNKSYKKPDSTTLACIQFESWTIFKVLSHEGLDNMGFWESV